MSLRISALDAQTGAAVADTDKFVVLDISDTAGTGGAATGTDKALTGAELRQALYVLGVAALQNAMFLR